jgi:hypothetical protein
LPEYVIFRGILCGLTRLQKKKVVHEVVGTRTKYMFCPEDCVVDEIITRNNGGTKEDKEILNDLNRM